VPRLSRAPRALAIDRRPFELASLRADSCRARKAAAGKPNATARLPEAVGRGSGARWEHARTLMPRVAKAKLPTQGGTASSAGRDVSGKPMPALGLRRQAGFGPARISEQARFSARVGFSRQAGVSEQARFAFSEQGSCLPRAVRPHYVPRHGGAGCRFSPPVAADEARLAQVGLAPPHGPQGEAPAMVKGRADGRKGGHASGLNRRPQIFHFSGLWTQR
jgi:hypothetical protein